MTWLAASLTFIETYGRSLALGAIAGALAIPALNILYAGLAIAAWLMGGAP